MNKDFNDFIALMNNKDWNLVPKEFYKNINGLNLSNPNHIAFLVEQISKSNLEAMLTILKEYHEWRNQ